MNFPCREIPFGSADYQAALALRDVILRQPLGLLFTPEEMTGESDSYHLGCFQGPRLVGALVLKPIDTATIKMRQVAIAADRQGQGIGSALVRFAESLARERGFRMMIAHAREGAVPFYRKLGYTVGGDRFIEVTIPHYAIAKDLGT